MKKIKFLVIAGLLLLASGGSNGRNLAPTTEHDETFESIAYTTTEGFLDDSSGAQSSSTQPRGTLPEGGFSTDTDKSWDTVTQSTVNETLSDTTNPSTTTSGNKDLEETPEEHGSESLTSATEIVVTEAAENEENLIPTTPEIIQGEFTEDFQSQDILLDPALLVARATRDISVESATDQAGVEDNFSTPEELVGSGFVLEDENADLENAAGNFADSQETVDLEGAEGRYYPKWYPWYRPEISRRREEYHRRDNHYKNYLRYPVFPGK